MTSTRSESYALVPVSPVRGAEVVGIDLADGVDEATAAALREAFWRHKVLVFRDQHLSPDAHVKARIFDEPFDHPLWLHRDPRNRLVYVFDLEQAGRASRFRSYVPSPGSELYTALTDSKSTWNGSDSPPVTETIEHPVVRRHRHTGRNGLFLSSAAIRFTGIDPGEGEAILPFLLAHASSPNYTVGFGWKPGDFVIWDNQATWHFAVDDYHGPRAYRKVIGG